MPAAFRARANVAQSLLRVLQQRRGEVIERLLHLIDREQGTARILSLASTTWIDGGEFQRLLDLVHQALGDFEYTRAVHEASVLMCRTGVVRAARMASNMFFTPSFGGYVKWAPRIWSLCFEGLAIDVLDSDGSGDWRVRLRHPPGGRFTKSIVLGAAGTLQTVYTLAHVSGQVKVQPYRENDADVLLHLRAGAKSAAV
jgi:hypothetical protein